MKNSFFAKMQQSSKSNKSIYSIYLSSLRRRIIINNKYILCLPFISVTLRFLFNNGAVYISIFGFCVSVVPFLVSLLSETWKIQRLDSLEDWLTSDVSSIEFKRSVKLQRVPIAGVHSYRISYKLKRNKTQSLTFEINGSNGIRKIFFILISAYFSLFCFHGN